MIWMAAPAIADSLTYIFNQAITLASFPDEWKIARVIPLFKSGHRNMPGNYRPISILPAISKIMERILYNQLYNYLTEYGLLSSAQFGFRKSHSTATALLNCTNEWYMNIDKKMFNLVDVIMLNSALYVPTYQQGIFSVHAAVKRGASVSLGKDVKQLRYPGGTTFEIKQKCTRLYYLHSISSSKDNACSLNECHKIMGHCNYGDLLKLEGVVESMHD